VNSPDAQAQYDQCEWGECGTQGTCCPFAYTTLLDLLTPNEGQGCLRLVEVMERGLHMSQAEADEWR
jgi:hypothetical protein